jgi:hypothetical protein
MSRVIGITVRIDMYMHQGEVVMGEFTFTPSVTITAFSKLEMVALTRVSWGAS